MSKFDGFVMSPIDLVALHAAYVAEGFDDVTTEENLNAGVRVYVRQGPDGVLHARVPVMPEDDSDLYDYLLSVHEEARQAVLFLVEVSGNQHFAVGSLLLTPSAI